MILNFFEALEASEKSSSTSLSHIQTTSTGLRNGVCGLPGPSPRRQLWSGFGSVVPVVHLKAKAALPAAAWGLNLPDGVQLTAIRVCALGCFNSLASCQGEILAGGCRSIRRHLRAVQAPGARKTCQAHVILFERLKLWKQLACACYYLSHIF